MQQILTERSRLEDTFLRFSYVEEVYPSDANFLLVKVTKPNALYNYLVEKGIVIRNRSTVILCDDCLRFTIGLAKENDLLLTALKAWEEVTH